MILNIQYMVEEKDRAEILHYGISRVASAKYFSSEHSALSCLNSNYLRHNSKLFFIKNSSWAMEIKNNVTVNSGEVGGDNWGERVKGFQEQL